MSEPASGASGKSSSTRPTGAAAPALSLPRRRIALPSTPFAVEERSSAARESINAFVSATRSPYGSPGALDPERISELERSLRIFEQNLADRERALIEAEARLAERERDVAETEALLTAREKILAATRRPMATAPAGTEERNELERVRLALEQQELSLVEARQTVRDRERFLEESEAKFFEKVQAQQEREIEMDQREENLNVRQLRLREAEAAGDPAVAAALKAEASAKRQIDEFKE